MGKIYNWDIRTGSVTDSINGVKLTLTNSLQIGRTEKGLGFLFPLNNNTLQQGATTSSVDHGTGNITYECYVNLKHFTGLYRPIIGNAGGGTIGLGIWADNTRNKLYAEVYGSSGGRQYSALGNYTPGWRHLLLTLDRNNLTLNLYINTILTISLVITNPGDIGTNFPIGNCNGLYCIDPIVNATIYDHVLTEKERVLSYRDFLNSYPQFPEKHPQQSLVSKPMDLSTEKDNTLGDNTLAGLAWSPDIGWAQIGDKLIASNTSSYILTIPSPIIAGKKYKVTYILTHVSGTVRTSFEGGGATLGTNRSSSGTYSEDIIALVSGHFYFTGIAFTGTIEFASCQEVTGLVAAYNFVPNGNILPDISGNGRNGTLVGNPMMIKDGIRLQRNNYIDLGATTTFNNLSNLTVLGRIKIISEMPYISGFFSQFTGINASLSLYIYYSTIIYIDIRNDNSGLATVGSQVLPINEYFDYAVVFNGNGETNNDKLKLYINSIEIFLTYGGNICSITAPDLNTVNFYIGDLGPAYDDDGVKELSDFRSYNRSLSLQEIKDYHNSFIKPSFIEDFSSEGADGVAKVPSGWFTHNGTYKVGEWQIAKGNLVLGYIYGRVTEVDNGDGSKTYTVNSKYADNQGLYKDNLLLSGKRGKLSFDAKSSNYTSTLFYNGRTSSAHVRNINNPNFATSYQHYEFEIFGGEVQFYLGFNNADVGTEFTIKNLIVEEILPVPTFKLGTKYAECITGDSALVIPSNQVYGTWQFDFYKVADARFEFVLIADDYIPVLSETPNYRVQVYENTNALRLLSEAGLLIETSSGYIVDSTWYSIKVTRSIENLFTLYIKGGGFGDNDWTRVSASGYGTNPVTDNTYLDSRYSFFNNVNGAGNRIANIKFLDGIRYQIKYSNEICINGGFDTDTSWSKSSGVTISDGKLSSNGTITDETLASVSVNYSFGGNKKFLYGFTVSGYVQGAVLLLLGGWSTPGDSVMGSNGHHEFEGYPNSGSGSALYIWSSGTFIGSIDNISIKEVFD